MHIGAPKPDVKCVAVCVSVVVAQCERLTSEREDAETAAHALGQCRLIPVLETSFAPLARQLMGLPSDIRAKYMCIPIPFHAAVFAWLSTGANSSLRMPISRCNDIGFGLRTSAFIDKGPAAFVYSSRR